MVCALLTLALAAAPTPFEDVHRRFTLELPAGWQFSPIAGDDGVAFRRQDGNLLANTTVRIIPLGPGDDLAAVGKVLAGIVERQKGYRVVAEGQTTLSGLPALRRRFVHALGEDARYTKMAEDRMAVHGGNAYIIHVETLAEAFGSFERDFDVLLSSFTIPGAKAEPELEPLSGELVGRWAMVVDPATILELRADGTFTLDGAAGVFRVAGQQLHLRPAGGGEESFAFRLRKDELTLGSPALGEPMRYRRLGTKKSKPAQP